MPCATIADLPGAEGHLPRRAQKTFIAVINNV